MSQVSDVTIAANPTGLALRTEQNSINGAFNSNHKGGSAPGSIEAGTMWIDDTNNHIWDVNFYDGTNSIKLCELDTTNNLTVFNDVSFKKTTQPVNTITSTSNAITVDLDDGSVFKHIFTEATTFTFSNPASSGALSSFLIFLTNAAGAYTPTWPGSVIWSNGVEPDVSTANEKNVLAFTTIDGGGAWYGSVVSEASA